ncbi:MAG: FdtA/QdtA family cupin domain-containing protein [Candidatus Magasanikbacteria bacterium]|nr:FdtA/QdtA family cupin domain-containing protein [Candidatus Magasanikbacteria bacterium]
MEKKFQQFEIKKIDTPRFVMSPVELKDYIDFEVKRVYFITSVKAPTGAHCHKIEEEFFILQKGTCLAVIDRGNGLEEIPMIAPTSAIYVPPYVWHHFKDLSSDAILLALSSTNYDPERSDYLEDYEDFKKIRNTD